VDDLDFDTTNGEMTSYWIQRDGLIIVAHGDYVAQ